MPDNRLGLVRIGKLDSLSGFACPEKTASFRLLSKELSRIPRGRVWTLIQHQISVVFIRMMSCRGGRQTWMSVQVAGDEGRASEQRKVKWDNVVRAIQDGWIGWWVSITQREEGDWLIAKGRTESEGKWESNSAWPFHWQVFGVAYVDWYFSNMVLFCSENIFPGECAVRLNAPRRCLRGDFPRTMGQRHLISSRLPSRWLSVKVNATSWW